MAEDTMKDGPSVKRITSLENYVRDVIWIKYQNIVSRATELAPYCPYVSYVMLEIAKHMYLDKAHDLTDIYRELTFWKFIQSSYDQGKPKDVNIPQGKIIRLSFLNAKMQDTNFGREPMSSVEFDSTSQESEAYKQHVLDSMKPGAMVKPESIGGYILRNYLQYRHVDDPSIYDSNVHAEARKKYHQLITDCEYIHYCVRRCNQNCLADPLMYRFCQLNGNLFMQFLLETDKRKIRIDTSCPFIKPHNPTFREKIQLVDDFVKKRKISEEERQHYARIIQDYTLQLKQLLETRLEITSSVKPKIEVLSLGRDPIELGVRDAFSIPFKLDSSLHFKACEFYLKCTTKDYLPGEKKCVADLSELVDSSVEDKNHYFHEMFGCFARKRGQFLDDIIDQVEEVEAMFKRHGKVKDIIQKYVDSVVQEEMKKKEEKERQKREEKEEASKANPSKSGKQGAKNKRKKR